MLDSLIGPKGLDFQAHQRFADGFDDRFGDFAAWAAARDDVYHLGRTPAEVTAKFFELAEKRGSEFRVGTWAALYDNILLVQNLRDAATPLVGAREMRAALGASARFVTVDAGGHGVFTQDNACGNDAVVTYLRDGAFPAADSHCPA